MRKTLIIGLDFSVDKMKRKAFALCAGDNNLIEVVDTKISNLDNQQLSSKLLELTEDWEEIILAIDSPMGWPVTMSRDLGSHKAGEKLLNESKKMRQNYFRRTTDIFVKDTLKQTPLSIGADKIASMAFDALELMSKIKSKFRLDTGYGIDSNYKVIEVYPSATIAYKLKNKSKYEGKKSEYAVRKKILKLIIELPDSAIDKKLLSNVDVLSSDHLFDAFLCSLTGIDYVQEKLCNPIEAKTITNLKMDEEVLRKEGWIWALGKSDAHSIS